MKKIIFIIWVLWLGGCVPLGQSIPPDIQKGIDLFNTFYPEPSYVNYDGKTISEEEEVADDRKTRKQAIVIYTAGGAALGGLIGQLAGKDKESTLTGLGVGGVVGYIWGTYEGNKAVSEKQRIDLERRAIENEIAHMEKVNSETKKYNKQLRRDIQYYNDLKTNNRLKEEDLENANKQYLEAKGLCEMTKKKLNELEARKSNTLNDNQGQIAKLDVEINELRKEIATLETQTEQLASVGQRRRV